MDRVFRTAAHAPANPGPHAPRRNSGRVRGSRRGESGAARSRTGDPCHSLRPGGRGVSASRVHASTTRLQSSTSIIPM